jgi:predicted MPP superfamily phosphohydrolase
MRRSSPAWRWVFPTVWLVLTLGCSLAHWRAWSVPEQATGRTAALDTLCKQVSNISQTVNAPAWGAAWFGLHAHAGLANALVVNGVGFACWVGAVWLVLAARRRLVRPTPPNAEVIEPFTPQALSRRAFLTDSALVTGTACIAGPGVYASFVTPWSLRTVRYTVPIKDLPADLDGLRLVQLTDTHLGPRIPASFITQAVDLAISLEPDLFVLTGDYLHMGTGYIGPAAALFGPLTERRPWLIGTVGVLGNHDHYADGPAVSTAMERVGVRMLDNRRLFLDGRDRRLTPDVTRRESVCIAGVGDLLEGTVDLHAALRGVPDGMARLVLSHNPDVAELPACRAPTSPRVDLMLSGHTHGGQVRLPFVGAPGIPSRYGQKYAYGLVRGPAFPVLVSAGVGMSLLPVRFRVDPEIVEITLKRA